MNKLNNNRSLNGPLSLLLISAAFVSGCSTIGTTALSDSKPGIAYFLPKQMTQVTAKRTAVKIAETIKKLTAAEAALATSKQTLLNAKNAVTLTELLLANSEILEEDKKKYREAIVKERLAVENAEKDVEEKQEKFDTAQRNLEQAIETAKAESDAGTAQKYSFDVDLALQSPIADKKFGYNLDPKHFFTRDDNHKIKITNAGLLSSANTVTADRTADIISEVASFAGAIISPGVSFGSSNGTESGASTSTTDCKGTPDELILMVDFSDQDSVTKLNRDLRCFGIQIDSDSDSGANGYTPPSLAGGGILYRTPVEVLLDIKKCKSDPCDDDDWITTKTVSQNLPQAGPISIVRQNAGFMTKSTYDLEFKDGTLTSYSSDRPSELLEIAKTPMRVVNGLFDGISKVISLQIGKNTKLSELSASELALVQSQIGLQAGENTALANLSATELALLRAQIGLAAGENNALAELSASELALLQAEIGLGTGRNTALAALSNSELALLQAQIGAQTGQNTALAALSDSELALLQSQIAVRTGNNTALASLSASELALLQAQVDLQLSTITNATTLTDNQLAQLRSQAALSIAQNEVSSAAVASQLATLISIQRDQSRIDFIETCLKDRVRENESIEDCLTDP